MIIMKLNSLSIFSIVFIVFLIEVANLLILPNWCTETKSVVVEYATMVLTGLAFVVFLFDYTMKKDDFLDTKIDVISKDNYHFVKTQVFNKSGMKKKVSFALIFISSISYLLFFIEISNFFICVVGSEFFYFVGCFIYNFSPFSPFSCRYP